MTRAGVCGKNLCIYVCVLCVYLSLSLCVWWWWRRWYVVVAVVCGGGGGTVAVVCGGGSGGGVLAELCSILYEAVHQLTHSVLRCVVHRMLDGRR